MPKPPTYDHLKSRKKPVIKTVNIALDTEIADEELQLQNKLEFIKIRLATDKENTFLLKELADTQAEYERAHAELVKNCMKFRFRSLGRKRFEDLVGQHVATEKQLAEAKKINPEATLDYNTDTFPLALCQACIVEPALSAEEMKELFESDDWSSAELAGLFEAALAANSSRRVINLGNESRGMNGSGSN